MSALSRAAVLVAACLFMNSCGDSGAGGAHGKVYAINNATLFAVGQ